MLQRPPCRRGAITSNPESRFSALDLRTGSDVRLSMQPSPSARSCSDRLSRRNAAALRAWWMREAIPAKEVDAGKAESSKALTLNRWLEKRAYSIFTIHEIGHELKAMSQCLDADRDLIGFGAAELLHVGDACRLQILHEQLFPRGSLEALNQKFRRRPTDAPLSGFILRRKGARI